MSSSQTRREFLKKVGLYSAISPPAVQALGFQQSKNSSGTSDLQDEGYAFERAIQGVDGYFTANSRNPMVVPKPNMPEHREVQYLGRNIFCVYTDFVTKDAIRYVHSRVVPMMRKDKGNWMVFRRNPDEKIKSPQKDPMSYYLQELEKLWLMPSESAVAELNSGYYRLAVETLLGHKYKFVDGNDIDRFIMRENLAKYAARDYGMIEVPSNVPGEKEWTIRISEAEARNVVREIAADFDFPPQYAFELQEQLKTKPSVPFTKKEFYEAWGDVSLRELNDNLKKHAGIGNVLVAVPSEILNISMLAS